MFVFLQAIGMRKEFKVDFIGIGASKAGSTWLGHMLESHPQLCMSIPKEVHFFNDILTYRNTLWEKNYEKGFKWYRKFFNHCSNTQLKGEITPRYSHDPIAAQRIKEHNKDVKILYCLRHPVDRIESHYNFSKYYLGKEDRPIQRAIREEKEFMDMTMYFRNLSTFLEHFPKNQIMLIWFEDIKEKPAELLKQVYSLLNVNPSYVPPNMLEKSNPGRISQ